MPRLFVLLAAVCFGTTGTAQALGPDAAPLTVGAARIAIGGALLLLVARAVPAAPAPWPRRELAVIAGAIAVYQLSFFAAVDRTGVAVGTVVALGSAPALAGLAGRLLDGEPLTGRWARATALAYVLFARGLRGLTPGETATLTLAEPLTATLLGVVALGERPGAVAAIGAALVLAGLVSLARPARRRPLRLATVPA